MLTSFNVLQNALEKYRKQKENYNAFESGAGGLVAGLTSGFVVLGIIFVALEFVVMFFAINVALKCTQAGPERIVHVVLAVAFTFPYMLLSLLFNKCASSALRGGTSHVPFSTIRT